MALTRRAFLTCAAASAAASGAGPAFAQAVLVVDRERVLSESAPARALRAAELERHRTRVSGLETLRAAFEAEEAELVELRRSLPTAEFEARTRAFDQKVREARAATQSEIAEINTDFAAARRRISAALAPILSEIAAERGAAVIIDARSALWAAADTDVTAEAIRRLDAVEMQFDLAPAPGQDGE